jgi:protein-tyrosine-phosphatase
VNVLFVCTGNTCRSPFAAAVARAHGVPARSAGTHAVAGDTPPREAVGAAAQFGVDLAAHRAARLSPELVSWADVIVGLDGRAADAAQALGAERPRVLAITDPWGGGPDAYRTAYRDIDAGVRALLAELG